MRILAVVGGIALLTFASTFSPDPVRAGQLSPASSSYSLLSPIRSGNLTVFPVVAGKSFDTGEFLTLDEGIRSGEVVVSEYGQLQGLVRRRPSGGGSVYPVPTGQVNRLALVNNSKRPLLLSAGAGVAG